MLKSKKIAKREAKKQKTQNQGLTTLIRERHIKTETCINFMCHARPTSKQEKNGNNYKRAKPRCSCEPTRLHLQVVIKNVVRLLVFLLLIFAIQLIWFNND